MTNNTFLLTMKLTHQGEVKGSSTKRHGALDYSNGMECHAYQYSVAAPYGSGTGRVVGKRNHSPVVITREADAASPRLFQAMVTSEAFIVATLQFNLVDQDGKRLAVRTIELANGRILTIRPKTGPKGRKHEEITLVYDGLTVNGVSNGLIPHHGRFAPAEGC